MISLAGLVNKITGKGAQQSDPTGLSTTGQGATDPSGLATGGAFAQLVQLAAQMDDAGAGTGTGGGKLSLVVDNGTGAATGAGLPGAGTPDGTGSIADFLLPLQASGLSPAQALRQAMMKAKADGTTPTGDDTAATVTMILANAGDKPAKAGDAAKTDADLTTDGQSGHDADGLAKALAQLQLPAGLVPVVNAAAGQPGTAQTTSDPAAKTAETAPQFMPLDLQALGKRPAASRLHAAAAKTDPAAAAVDGTATAAAFALPDDGTRLGGTSKASSSSSSATSQLPISDASPIASPLAAIVETLPPVIQSELGPQGVSGVSGPSTGEALGDKVIDMGVSGQWIDRMAREIADLADGSGHSRFTLNPPHLGKLQIDLWQDDGATSVRMTTETDEATRRLAEGRAALQADARLAALSLGSITVEKSGSAQDAGTRDSSQGQRQTGDLAGQMQQQADSQARSGNGQSSNDGRAGDWVRRTGREDSTQLSDAATRTPAARDTDRHVRFA